MSTRPVRQLLYGDHSCGKTSQLVEATAGLLADPTDAPSTLALSVHRHAVRGLRGALRERVAREVPTTDVRRRATAILEQFPLAVGLPAGWTRSDVMSAVDRRALIWHSWASVNGALYAGYGAQPGVLDWLTPIFDLFAEWSGTADPGSLSGLRPADPALAELWMAYRTYLESSLRLGVVAFQEVVPRVLDALRSPEVRAALMPELLVLDDLDLFRPSELLFAGALIGAETAVLAATATVPQADGVDPRLRYLARWCAAHGMEHGSISALHPLAARNRTFLTCATPQEEADAIGRMIATDFPPDGRFADYAVICFDPELVPLLRRTLPRWGIAVEGMDGRTAYTLPLAQLLLAGMRLIAGVPMPSTELLDLLRHPALGLAEDDRLARTPVHTAPGSPAGDPLATLKRWRSQLASTAGRVTLDRLIAATETARRRNAPSTTRLRSWLAALDLDEPDRYLAHSAWEPWVARADSTVLQQWLGFLERSERFHARLGQPLSDVDAVDILRSSQSLVEPVSRRLTDAVQIWQPDQLSGCQATTVWVAGLHEHVLPGRSSPLAWVAPEAFAALESLPGYVPVERDDRAARWDRAMHQLRRAAGRAAERMILSWSRTDSRGRRRLRSPIVDAFVVENRGSTSQDGPMAWEDASRLASVRRSHLVSPLLHPVGAIAGAPPLAGAWATSPSAIEDYLHCPRRYFYARMLHLDDVVASPRQALGQVVHAALSELKQMGPAAPSPDTLVAGHWPTGERPFGTSLREAAYRRLAEQAVTNVARFDAEQHGDTGFVVSEAAFCWRIAPDVELRGKVDRVDRGPDGLVVLDYKMGANSPSINALLHMFAPPNDDQSRATWRPSDLQLPLYALALEHGEWQTEQLPGGERVAGIGLIYPLLLYTATGRPAAAGRRLVRIVDHEPGCAACGSESERAQTGGMLCRDQLRRIAARALQAIEGMRAGNIAPDPIDGARTCASCTFRAICPAPHV